MNCIWEKVVEQFSVLFSMESPVYLSGTFQRILRQDNNACDINIEIDTLEKENRCTTKLNNKFLSPRSL